MGLAVLLCGNFQIHMGQVYPKNMSVLKVYAQNVPHFYRIQGFFCKVVYLQKRKMMKLYFSLWAVPENISFVVIENGSIS